MTITALPATELAARIARGELSAREAVEAHIARIEHVNPRINALVVRRYEAARTEARDADARRARGEPLGPLEGVPVTIKDSLDVEGLPSTFGLPTRATHRAEVDETHVARLRAAGAIVLGKTNVSQCLAYTEADNPVYGRTVNPWNAERTSGGSSGGEGALIASGGSPLGLGTDIGGSVRVPASFCGIASLKPTTGRMDDPGEFSFAPGQRAVFSQVGVMARRAADVALGYRIAASPLAGERRTQHPLGDPGAIRIPQLRVAFHVEDGTFETAPAVQRAVREVAAALAAQGASVAQWSPPDVPLAARLFGAILTADGGAHLRRVLEGNPRTPQIRQLLAGASTPTLLLPALKRTARAFGQDTLEEVLESFGNASTDRYWSLVEAQERFRARFTRALDDGAFDLVLAPVCSLPAFTHGATRDLLTAGACASLYNLLGWPAGVVPWTRVRAAEQSTRTPGRDAAARLAQRIEQGSTGLPVGVQLAARPWQEHVVLAAMMAVESVAVTREDFPRTPVDPS